MQNLGLDFLVNYFPFLEVIPSWFPGAGWKRLAETWRQDKENMINVPYEWAKQHMVCRPGTICGYSIAKLMFFLRR
jgi:hypothetical protein